MCRSEARKKMRCGRIKPSRLDSLQEDGEEGMELPMHHTAELGEFLNGGKRRRRFRLGLGFQRGFFFRERELGARGGKRGVMEKAELMGGLLIEIGRAHV